MTHLRAERETAHEPPIRPVGVPVPRQAAESIPAPTDGVPVTRLLAAARLTPAQAVELGSGLLAAVAGRRDRSAGADGVDGITIDDVAVGTDGRVRLRPARSSPADRGEAAVDPTGASVGPVLAVVARAARLSSPDPGPAAEQVLAGLDLAVAELQLAAVSVVARTLDDVAASVDHSAVRAELAALVEALRGNAAAARSTGAAGARGSAVRAAPSGRAGSGESRNAGRRIRAWLLTVLVLAGVVLLEFAVLRDKIATDVTALLDAGRGGATPLSAAKPDGLPIVPPAPAAAGSVRTVDLRPLAPCATGSRCSLRLLVSVVPGAHRQVVTWSYRIVDRCTGGVHTAPGGSVTVPAHGQLAVVVSAVRLPAGRAEAVVAVTRVPAAAASTPVLVGSCRSRTG